MGLIIMQLINLRVFPRPFTHGGTSAGGQIVNGGTHQGDIDLMGGLIRGT